MAGKYPDGHVGASSTQLAVLILTLTVCLCDVKQQGGGPVQDSGHEVQIWKHDDGVISLVSPTGPNGRSLQYATDGLQFEVLLRECACH